MADDVPPFNPKGSRFDQSTFWGRLSHFRQMVDPQTLLTTPQQLKAAQDLLSRQERGQAAGISDHELWEAKRVKDAIIHLVFYSNGFLSACFFFRQLF